MVKTESKPARKPAAKRAPAKKAPARKAPAKKPAAAKPKAAAPATVPSTDIFQPFVGLRRDIDRLFEDFGRSWPSLLDFDPFRRLEAGFEGLSRGMAPRVDLSETDKAYEITAELPGVEEKEVELSLQERVLTLSGEKRSEKEEEKKGYHLSERSYGSFRRSFRLPDDVDEDKIQAAFEKGVMHVTLPKKAGAKAKGRSIPVR
jgi:HSP20 family protein